MYPMFGKACRYCPLVLILCALHSGCEVGTAGTGYRGPVGTAIDGSATADGQLPRLDASTDGSNATDGSVPLPDATFADATWPVLDAARGDATLGPGDATAGDAEQTGDSTVALDDATAPIGDAAEPFRDAAPDAATHDAGKPDDSCLLSGDFGARVLLDVTWNGTTALGFIPMLDPGAGQIEILVHAALTKSGDNVQSDISLCGLVLPDFSAKELVGEVYSGYVEDSAWVQNSMPVWPLTWRLTCARPGCAIGSERLLATFGARSLDTDVWPGRSGPREQITPLDHDDDGLPAITFLSRRAPEISASGTPYSEIPLSPILAARAASIQIAYQVSAQFQGAIDDCNTISGVVSRGSVQARAVHCEARNVVGITGRCTEPQIDFIDNNVPDWAVQGGTFEVARLPTGSGCPSVRDQWSWSGN